MVRYPASMYRAELHKTVDAPWAAMEPIRVGPVPTGAGTPGVYLTVERDGTPFTRVDAWPLFGGPFTEFCAWKQFVVLGWNDQVHIIDPFLREVRSIECDGYFGSVFPTNDSLLITSASRVICVNDHGTAVWNSGVVGIDGVVIDDVQDGIINGRGEWDPPGGWKPFRLSMESGRPAAG